MKTKIRQIINKNAQLAFADGILEEITNDINDYVNNTGNLGYANLYAKLKYWFNSTVAHTIAVLILEAYLIKKPSKIYDMVEDELISLSKIIDVSKSLRKLRKLRRKDD